MSNRADLRERTKTISHHGDHWVQIADFRDSFERIKWLYLLCRCGIKTKTHFEWVLWHWSSLNSLMGWKVPTDLVKISVKEDMHMGFYYILTWWSSKCLWSHGRNQTPSHKTWVLDLTDCSWWLLSNSPESRRFPLKHEINGLVQERRNSSGLAMELRLSCTNPSKYSLR